jgi:AcrR family transcriptional regulator
MSPIRNGTDNHNSVEERILASARRMHMQSGYVATTMRQIAKDVGMEAQSLYNYFDSKQAIFAELTRRGTAALRDAVEHAIDAAGSEPRDRLWAAMKAHTKHYCDFDQVILPRELLPHIDDELRSQIVTILKSYEDIFKGILVAGIEAGQFRAVDVSPTSFALLGMGESVLNWYKPGGRLTAEALATQYADHALNTVTGSYDTRPDTKGN